MWCIRYLIVTIVTLFLNTPVYMVVKVRSCRQKKEFILIPSIELWLTEILRESLVKLAKQRTNTIKQLSKI